MAKKSKKSNEIDYSDTRNPIELYLAKAIGENVTLPETDNERILVYLRKLIEVIGGKQDKSLIDNQTAPSAITLADNTEYYLTDVSSLALTYPTGNFECWLRITTASSGTITITLPTSEYIGAAPTFGNGETWELSIKDGVIVAGQVTV